jgi:hypothetical protein
MGFGSLQFLFSYYLRIFIEPFTVYVLIVLCSFDCQANVLFTIVWIIGYKAVVSEIDRNIIDMVILFMVPHSHLNR